MLGLAEPALVAPRRRDNRFLYATVLGWPGGTLNITTMSSNRINLGTLTSVQLLGSTAGTYAALAVRDAVLEDRTTSAHATK